MQNIFTAGEVGLQVDEAAKLVSPVERKKPLPCSLIERVKKECAPLVSPFYVLVDGRDKKVCARCADNLIKRAQVKKKTFCENGGQTLARKT